MTKAHIILHQYINKKFHEGAVKIQDIGQDEVKLTDCNGETMTLTMNIYCDIMDADTKQVYAKSNLPHDLNHIGTKLPTDWTEIPR
jgi:hypothetical protein